MQTQIVLFFDLLGFRARMVQARNNAKQADELLAEYNKVMGSALDQLQTHAEGLFTYRGFTDNFVLATPLGDGLHPEERFGLLITEIARFQMELAVNGWFIRGGIAVGPFYMDDRLVFGSALIDAYELESKIARDPRIILDTQSRNWMRSFLEFYAEKESAPQNSDVLVDTDGYAFVNYLAANYLPEDPSQVTADAQAHKEQVERALNASQTNPNVWSKYRWVAEYHNFFVDNWLPHAAATLRISPDVLVPTPTYLADVQLPHDFPVPWGTNPLGDD